MEQNKTNEFHGGQLVYSKRHRKNMHILLAHHKNGKVDHYVFVDGSEALPHEVEEARQK